MRKIRRVLAGLLLCVMLFTVTGCETVSELLDPNRGSFEIIITEVMTQNRTTLADEDGEYSDYIVLYNAGKTATSLWGAYLTDKPSNPQKWALPAVTLQPDERLVVFASGKDRRDGEYHTNFSLSSQGEKLQLIAPSGMVCEEISIPALPEDIAYGITADGYKFFAQGMPYGNNTSEYADTAQELIKKIEYSIVLNEYMNNTRYFIPDGCTDSCDWIELYNAAESDADLSGMMLTDNAENIDKWIFPEGTTIPAGGYLLLLLGMDGENCVPFALSATDTVLILTDTAGVTVFNQAIEYLPQDVSCGVTQEGTGYFTQPTPGTENTGTYYATPAQATALAVKGVRINEVSAVPTNTSKDVYDWIELYNPLGASVSLAGWGIGKNDAAPDYIFDDITIGADKYLVLYAANETPAKPTSGAVYLPFNIDTSGEELYLFDADGRVVDYIATGKLRSDVTCGRNDDGVRVYYAKPTPGKENGSWYKSYAAVPVLNNNGGYAVSGTVINAACSSGETVRYTIDGSEPTAASQEFNGITVNKNTVLKVRTFKDGYICSDVVTATYIVGETHTIPFVSLVSEPDGLFGYNNGILADGPGYSSSFPHKGANFWKDWERKATVEYYLADGTKELSFDAGIKIAGQYSRGYDQKSLAVHMRDKYGTSKITYPLFKDNPVTTIKDFVLRAGGQDQSRTHIRDAFSWQVMKGNTTLVGMDWQPVALYINGEYWGFYEIREKVNEDYLITHGEATSKDVTMLKGGSRVMNGSNTEYVDLRSYIKAHDMSVQEYYDYVTARLDVDNYIDYLITEIYFGNGDTGNIKFYKDTAEGSKWKWIMFDFDMTLRDECIWSNNKYNTIEMLFNPDGHGSNNGFPTTVQRGLIKNPEFKQKFITRYAELLNTVFMPDNMLAVLQPMVDAVDEEMKLQGVRWNKPTYDTWVKEVANLKNVIKKRPAIAKKQLKAFFGMTDDEYKALFPNG